MNMRIKLPSGPLVEFYSFTRAIAEAICPTGEHGANGIECVTGKLISLQGLTSMAAQPTHDADEHASHRAPELTVVLSDADRILLRQILAQLPPLSYPMLADDVAVFMKAYDNLPARPAWRPELLTEATVNARKDAQHKVLMLHQRALRLEVAEGRIVPLSAEHVPVVGFMAGVYLSRAQAVLYLERCGLQLIDGTVAKAGFTGSSGEHSGLNAGSAAQPVPAGTAKLTPKQRIAVVERVKQLRKAKAPAPTKQTANEFGISDSRVRALMRGEGGGQTSAKSKGPRIDQILASKG